MNIKSFLAASCLTLTGAFAATQPIDPPKIYDTVSDIKCSSDQSCQSIFNIAIRYDVVGGGTGINYYSWQAAATTCTSGVQFTPSGATGHFCQTPVSFSSLSGRPEVYLTDHVAVVGAATAAELTATTTLCSNLNAMCVLNTNTVPLTGDLTLDPTVQWIAAGGEVYLNGHNLSANIWAPDFQPFIHVSDANGYYVYQGSPLAHMSAGWFDSGATDQYPALQTALTSCLNSSQSVMVLPRGVYTLDGSLPLTMNGCSLYGTGVYASKIKRSNTNTSLYLTELNGDIGNAANQTITNIQLDGNQAGNANANYLMALHGNVLNLALDHDLFVNAKTGCWYLDHNSVGMPDGRPNGILWNQTWCHDSVGYGIVADAGVGLKFVFPDFQVIANKAYYFRGAQEPVSDVEIDQNHSEVCGYSGDDCFFATHTSNFRINGGSWFTNGSPSSNVGSGIVFSSIGGANAHATITDAEPSLAYGTPTTGHYGIDLDGLNYGSITGGYGSDNPLVHIGSGTYITNLGNSADTQGWSLAESATISLTSTVLTVLPFDTVVYDSAALAGGAALCTAGVCTIQVAGVYDIDASAEFIATTGPATTAGYRALICIDQNGGCIKQNYILTNSAELSLTSPQDILTVHTKHTFNIGDTVDISVRSDSTAPTIHGQVVRNTFAATWERPLP